MNQQLSEGYESYLRIIGGAAAGKAEAVFAEYARMAMDCALRVGFAKGDAADRIRNAGLSAGLVDDVMDKYWAAAVSFAEAAGPVTAEIRSENAENVTVNVESAKSSPRSSLNVIRMSDVTPVSIEYLWLNRLARGKAHGLAGEGGQGKSTILADLTARATTGDVWPDGAAGADAGDVIWLSSEDDVSDTLAPRLIAAGADMTRVFVVRSVCDEQQRHRGFSLQADLHRLEELIETLPNAIMVILDPITSYLGAVDSHKNSDVRGVLDPLNDFASRTRVVVIANNHFSKGGGTANSRFIGSVAFVNAARAAFIVTSDEADETRKLLIPSKSNIGPLGAGMAYRIEGCLIEHDGKSIPTSRVMYESEPITISADKALAALLGGEASRSAKDEASDFLEDLLASGPVPAKEVQSAAREAGISTKSLRTAKDALGIKPEKSGMKGGWVWSLRRCPSDAEGVLPREGTSSAGGSRRRRGRLMVLARIDSLRRLAARCGTADDHEWLAGVLTRYLGQASEGLALVAALEIDTPWWLQERRARRNSALREYASRFLAGRDDVADALGTAVRRYEAGRWLSDRRVGRSPPQFAGTPRELLFAACFANSPDGSLPMPTSAKQLERILNNCEG